MGRPREFDIDRALDSATALFRSKGYEATTLSDLIAATGVQKSSLYQLWEGKRAIYLAALSRYLRLEREQFLLISGGRPSRVLRQVIDHVVSQCADPLSSGCFCTNSRVELGPVDPDVQAQIAEHVSILQGLFADVIKRGQASGEFRDDKPAGLLADAFYTHIVGMLARSRFDEWTPTRLRAVARMALHGLEPRRT